MSARCNFFYIIFIFVVVIAVVYPVAAVTIMFAFDIVGVGVVGGSLLARLQRLSWACSELVLVYTVILVYVVVDVIFSLMVLILLICILILSLLLTSLCLHF